MIPSTTLLPYFSAYSRQATFVRRPSLGHPVNQLGAAIGVSARHQIALTTALTADEQVCDVAPTTAWWRIRLAVASSETQGAVTLMTDDPCTPVIAEYARDKAGPAVYDRLRVDFPDDLDLDDQALASWFAAVADAYEADAAWVHTKDLAELIRQTVQTELREAPLWWSRLPAQTMQDLGGLRSGLELDVCAVPEAVWWMNVWSAPMIAQLGADRLSSVTWHSDTPLLGGSRLLVATEESPDESNLAAIGRIAAITRQMDLAALQRS